MGNGIIPFPPKFPALNEGVAGVVSVRSSRIFPFFRRGIQIEVWF